MAEDEQAMTVRIPRPLHERLRRLAFETREPMNQIVIAAINAEIERRQGNGTGS